MHPSPPHRMRMFKNTTAARVRPSITHLADERVGSLAKSTCRAHRFRGESDRGSVQPLQYNTLAPPDCRNTRCPINARWEDAHDRHALLHLSSCARNLSSTGHRCRTRISILGHCLLSHRGGGGQADPGRDVRSAPSCCAPPNSLEDMKRPRKHRKLDMAGCSRRTRCTTSNNRKEAKMCLR